MLSPVSEEVERTRVERTSRTRLWEKTDVHSHTEELDNPQLRQRARKHDGCGPVHATVSYLYAGILQGSGQAKTVTITRSRENLR